MITICHPVDDTEALFIRMELEAVGIPHFIVGQNFGSLYPGMQLPWYNERSIRVHPTFLSEALEVIQHVRSYYSPAFENLTKESKLRIILESLFFSWVIPAGNKKPSDSAFNPAYFAAFGQAVHADSATWFTSIRPGSRSAATLGLSRYS